MKHLMISLMVLFFSSKSFAIDISPYKEGQILTVKQATEMQQRYLKREQQAWKEAETLDSLNQHKNKESILYGIRVLDKTALTIGTKVTDTSMRYSGNNLNCSSCHLKGSTQLPGTQYKAIPFTNMINDYPQFRKRGMSIVSATARVNSCMTRSMGNGQALPIDSKEMQGILAYFDWLGEGTKKELAMEGTGIAKVIFPDRQANVIAGKTLYQQFCFACHGQEALGTKAADYEQIGSYIFPPLAGHDSFNDGAGMSRLKTATRFIHANMPLGVTSKNPQLSNEQAYDVAAYILSLSRTHKSGREHDFPEADFRPDDYAIPEYFGDNKKALEQAKLGPYTP